MKKKLLNSAKSKHYGLDNGYSIFGLESNLKNPDIETIQVLNDSEYLNRLHRLWGDLTEWF